VQAVPPTPPAIVSPAPTSAPSPLPSSTPLAGPWIAAPRPWSTEKWLAQHDAFVARAKQGNVDVLFIGDSLAEFFATRGKDVWDREITPLGNVVDFGIAGDRTQFVLWRVQNGELDGTNARVVVLMVGTNNLATATPENVARGVAAIVDVVRAKLPNATIVMNALFPRGDPDDPLRAKIADVNTRLAVLAGGAQVRWVNAGPGFITEAGTISPALMPDKLHPSPAGYEIWATALRPVLLDALSK
jgi:lysophospholipase L1-like esterase